MAEHGDDYEAAWAVLRKKLTDAGYEGDELEEILSIVDGFLDEYLFDLE
jgi:hypothetical protein